MKKNDIVILTSQSCVLQVYKSELLHPTINPCRDMAMFDVFDYNNYNQFRVIQTGLKLPSTEDGEYMDAIIENVKDKTLLFVQEKYLRPIIQKDMITIKGKEYSEETIHEALKNHIGE